MENIGARRLGTVLNHLLSDLLFDIPGKTKLGENVEIDKKKVQDRLTSLIEEKDSSKYIL